MKETFSEEDKIFAHHLIDKYRESVERRYVYEDLKERFTLSSQFDEEVTKDIKKYFLGSLYPPVEERIKIDAAFDRLNSFVSHPSKTWRLLGNMTMAVLKFGRHFPKALRAGIVSLESYLDAKRFERELLHAAKKLGFTQPLAMDQFEQCIAEISRKEIDEFTDDVISLFASMTDTELLKKTISILEDVTHKMKKMPDIYSKEDVEGVELGIRVLRNGYLLFKGYKPSLKTELLVVIRENERWHLDRIYEKYPQSSVA